jgi:hypothetical protein
LLLAETGNREFSALPEDAIYAVGFSLCPWNRGKCWLTAH